MNAVTLIETNAGMLFAGIPGLSWFDVTLGKPGSFAEDAECIATGETDDWNLDTYDYQPEGEQVATWANGRVEIAYVQGGLTVAGIAATKYVGILTPDTLGDFANKHLTDGEYVEIEASDPEHTGYTVRRAHMGVTQWEGKFDEAYEVIEACKEWGLDGWHAGLYGEE